MLFFHLFYVAYISFDFDVEPIFKLIIVEAFYANYFIISTAYQIIQISIMWFMYVLLMYE